MTIAIVAGANGAIGNALLTRLQADHRVIALSRQKPANCDPADWLQTGILDESTLASAAHHLRQTNTPITRIIIATGRLATPEKSMKALALAPMLDLFAINAIGPALAAKHLLPLTPRDQPHVFAALSARVGSITDNHLGGWYTYRASKAALNMLIKTLAIEHRRTRPQGICAALHPGTVDSALSAPFQANVPDGHLFTPEKAAHALVTVINNLTPNDNGGFFAWDGAPIPW